jgi:hypothetical protein
LAGSQRSSGDPLLFYFGFRFSNCLRHRFPGRRECPFGRK